MHRFFVPPAECQGPLVCLRDREAHHALRVLRLNRGDPALVLDGAGCRLSCTISDTARDTVSLEVTRRELVRPRRWKVTLFQCLPKGSLIENIIEKAIQLGVSRIVPVLSERVVAKLDPRDCERKRGKWQQVAIEALKQCGSAWLPHVETPAGVLEWLARNERFDLPLIASLQPGSRHPSQYLSNPPAFPPGAIPAASVWIGPEGDFTPAEVEAITSHGALPISLGPLVLRTETAAVYCLSILNYELERTVI